MAIHIAIVNVLPDVREQLAAHGQAFLRKHDDVYIQIVVRNVIQQKCADGIGRNPQRLRLRIAMRTGADHRKRDAFALMLHRKLKGFLVAGNQLPFFPEKSSVPDRADGMNDIFARKLIAARDFCFAHLAAAQRPAFGKQLGPGRLVDGAVDAASAVKIPVARADNGVHMHAGNIIPDDLNGHWRTSCRQKWNDGLRIRCHELYHFYEDSSSGGKSAGED